MIKKFIACLVVLITASHAHAYVFYKTSSCVPGSRWSTASTVNVYFLISSLTSYHADQGITDQLSDYVKAVQDIEAVISEYNSVAGSALNLSYGGPILYDDNLDDYGVDTFASDSIVIGFTDLSASSNAGAPAWAPSNPNDGCLYSSRHIYFKKTSLWDFGVPPHADVDGKYFGAGISFRAVLLHEMGHALGLAHETDEYAVMNHGTKAWTRGVDDVLQMELLPDDIQGINALYDDGSSPQQIDVSVTNTWFMSAAARTEYNRDNDIRHSGCEEIADELADLRAERRQLQTLIPLLQGAGLLAVQGQLAALNTQIAQEEDELDECYYEEDQAAQTHNCKVSSRGDGYADREDGLVYCAINSSPTSYAMVDNSVCPGDYIQLRVTLNNKSLTTDLDVELQMWVSQDDDLEVNGSRMDYQSADIREWTSAAGRSSTLGYIFRVPGNVPPSTEPYRIYVRAVPYETNSSTSRWWDDVDLWNNSLRMRGDILVSTACP